MNRCLPQNSGVLRAVSIENRNRILFEYTLSLDLRVKRGEYADFLRAITPLGVDLLELVINQYCGIDIHRYYDLSDKSIKKMEPIKIRGKRRNGDIGEKLCTVPVWPCIFVAFELYCKGKMQRFIAKRQGSGTGRS